MPQNSALQTYNTGIAHADELCRLHLNENPYGISPRVKLAIEAEMQRLHFYPDTDHMDLRACIARHHHVNPENVLVGNGTDELILLTALTLLGERKTSLLTASTFPGYKVVTTLSGASCRAIPMDGYRLPVRELAQKCQGGVDMVFICNPHNPTGTAINGEELSSLLQTISTSGAVAFLDEAYADFADQPFASGIPFVRDGGRALVARTFSKSYGLAGLRIGYVLGPEDLLTLMRHTRASLPFSVNRLAQVAARTLLDEPEYLKYVQLKNQEIKTYFYAEMKRMQLSYVPSQTNFVLIQVPGDSAVFSQSLLREYGILVRDTTPFGYPNHIRISMGSREQMEYVCKAIAALARHKNAHLTETLLEADIF